MNNQGPLLGQRAAVIFLLGALVGLGAGVCTVLAGGSPAGGVLAGGAAFGASVMFFHAIID
ncbi:hypothetical protein AB0O31_26820 [Kitasatospora cineracea]|uniref:hypothetical protein n=1 Tax=Kitasatospora cineracea TaxID=88074 RepID=UPI0034389540